MVDIFNSEKSNVLFLSMSSQIALVNLGLDFQFEKHDIDSLFHPLINWHDDKLIRSL